MAELLYILFFLSSTLACFTPQYPLEVTTYITEPYKNFSIHFLNTCEEDLVIDQKFDWWPTTQDEIFLHVHLDGLGNKIKKDKYEIYTLQGYVNTTGLALDLYNIDIEIFLNLVESNQTVTISTILQIIVSDKQREHCKHLNYCSNQGICTYQLECQCITDWRNKLESYGVMCESVREIEMPQEEEINPASPVPYIAGLLGVVVIVLISYKYQDKFINITKKKEYKFTRLSTEDIFDGTELRSIQRSTQVEDEFGEASDEDDSISTKSNSVLHNGNPYEDRGRKNVNSFTIDDQ